jgi:DNA-binding NarL/FixJ family response regulator
MKMKLRGILSCHLTPKEQEVLDLACTNVTYQEVATSLNISVKTVCSHMYNIGLKRSRRTGRNLVVDELLRRITGMSGAVK